MTLGDCRHSAGCKQEITVYTPLLPFGHLAELVRAAANSANLWVVQQHAQDIDSTLYHACLNFIYIPTKTLYMYRPYWGGPQNLSTSVLALICYLKVMKYDYEDHNEKYLYIFMYLNYSLYTPTSDIKQLH